MRRFSHLLERVISPANLWSAWREFRRGKRSRSCVRAFEVDAERQVLRLGRDLAAGRYEPSGYRLKMIYEPKRRLIAAAPVRDRVVHHAVHRVLSPLLDRRFIDTSFACRPGYGNHRAVLAFVKALRTYRYVLLLDIRHYFLSVDRRILLRIMEMRIKDRGMMELLQRIAESGEGLYRSCGIPRFLGLELGFPAEGCGMPIGNLTSQWWGNHYIDGVDHFVKRQLKIPHYQRYMDDLALFSDSEAHLERAREATRLWLMSERRLHLKKPGAPPRSTKGSFTYLGYRVSRAGARPTSKVVRRMQQRLGEVVLRGSREQIERSVASYRGVLDFPRQGRCGIDPMTLGREEG